MNEIAWFLIGLPVAVVGYTYVGYPLLLWLLSRRPPRPTGPVQSALSAEWPSISISVPVYNEEAQIRGLIESLLALDYPADRRQILIVSDASTDRTDEIVREYAGRGVELFRVPARGGKTAAENAAAPRLRGEIVVNTDASIRILPGSLKPLIASFADPEVGVASGRDVSVGRHTADANLGEAGYVGYEMTVRALETRAGGIIGASGCFYAIRSELHRTPLPAHLSRDFAAALIAREHGYRAVSVDGAVCLVPRAGTLRQEYRRKVRTMSRGMETLLYKRHLLNPFRYGSFAWKLWSHKVLRWVSPIGAVPALVGLGLLAGDEAWARWALGTVAAGAVAALLGARWPAQRPVPRPLSIAAAAAAANIAAVHSLIRSLRGAEDPVWDPTRREPVLPVGKVEA